MLVSIETILIVQCMKKIIKYNMIQKRPLTWYNLSIQDYIHYHDAY